jgi:hypothetical protein
VPASSLGVIRGSRNIAATAALEAASQVMLQHRECLVRPRRYLTFKGERRTVCTNGKANTRKHGTGQEARSGKMIARSMSTGLHDTTVGEVAWRDNGLAIYV